MSPGDDSESKPRPRRHLGHGAAGQAYTASPAIPTARTAEPREQVASRSTDAEARDLLALRRAKRGDDASFAALLSANDASVRALLSALVGTADLDAQCTQAYLRAYRGLPVAPATSPRLWLLGVADGTARDSLRRHARRSAAADHVDAPPIPPNLPPDQRLILAAIEAVGLTPREAARLTPAGLAEARILLEAARDNPGVALPLPPPGEHGPHFWDDLGRHLLIERSAPAVAAPKGDRAAAAVASAGTSMRGTPDTGRAARGMAMRVSQQQPKAFPWRALFSVVATVTTVAVIVGIALVFAGHASRHDAGLGETATKVVNRLDSALANDVVIQGTVLISSKDPTALPEGRYRFARSNTGSWRIVAVNGSMSEGYDVRTATLTTLRRDPKSGTTQATVRHGLAPGPPGPTAVARDSLGDVLGESVRLVRSGSNGVVTTQSAPTTSHRRTSTTVAGTPQWVVTSGLTEPRTSATRTLAGTGAFAALHADAVTLVADQSFTLPTAVTLRRTGRTVATLRFQGFSISQQPLDTSYAPAVPAVAKSVETNGGFVSTEIGKLATTTDGPVPTPSYLPTDFVISAAATNASTHTAVLCYRYGSRQLVITIRPNPKGRSSLADPFAAPGSQDSESDKIKISSGSFSGQGGFASVTPLPHVWVPGTTTEVIAAGDPATDELIKVVSSLR